MLEVSFASSVGGARDPAERRELARECAAQWLGGRVKAVALLEEMGPLLTSSSVGCRLSGVSFLSDAISNLPADHLSRDESGLFVRFYCDRLKNDHHSLNPAAISGLCALLTGRNVDDDDLALGVRSLLNGESMHVQTQVKAERSLVFKTIRLLLKSRLESLLKLKSEFVLGYIQSVDGEKDPTNLSVIFSTWPTVIEHFPLEPFTEDLFETLACYFPIDFVPNQEASSVTRDELVLALRTCLSCEPSFSALAVPLLLEKLDSDLEGAKLDASLTLAACLRSYRPRHVAPFLRETWRSLEKEILGIRAMGPPSPEVKRTCLDLLTAVTKALLDDGRELERWLSMVWEDCGRHLKEDPELRPASLAVEVLAAIANRNGEAVASFVLDRAVPILLENDSPTKLRCLGHVALLLSSGAAPDGASGPPSGDWYDRYLHETSSAMSSDEAFDEACGAAIFAKRPDLERIADLLFERFTTSPSPPRMGPKCADLLGKLARDLGRPNDDEVHAMFRRLATSDDVLSLIEVCGRDAKVFEEKLLPRAEELLGSDSTLMRGVAVLERFWKPGDFNERSPDPSMIALPRSAAFGNVVRFAETANVEEQHRLGRFVSSVVGTMDERHVGELKGILGSVATGGRVHETVWRSSPGSVLRGLEGGLLEEVFATPSLRRIQSSVLNKIPDPGRWETRLRCGFEGRKLDLAEREHVAWAVKGLALRPFHRIHDGWIGLLMVEAKAHFGMVVRIDEDEAGFYSYDRKAFAFARQKIFHLTKDGLAAEYGSTKNPEALKALVCQLPHLPRFVLSAEMRSLLPLLKGCLEAKDDDDDEGLVLAGLSCTKDVIGCDVAAFSDDLVPALLPLWLDLSSFERSMEVRIKALECVEVASGMERKELAGFRRAVSAKLNLAVDDRKRLVRKAAADARNAWCMAA